MPSIMIIFVYGNSKIDIEKNVEKLKIEMREQDLFQNISDATLNKPQIYYCDLPAVPTKRLNKIIDMLKNNKKLNQVVKRVLVSINFLPI